MWEKMYDMEFDMYQDLRFHLHYGNLRGQV